MGNNQPQTTQKQRVFLEHKIDINYGEILVYLDENRIPYTEIKKVMSESGNMSKLEQNIEDRAKLMHIGVVPILGVSRNSIKDLCSSYNVMIIKVQYYGTNILDDQSSRRHHRTSYSENELLYIIYSMVDTMCYLQESGYEIQDMHPQRILIDEHRQLKLYDSFIENECVSNFHKVVLGLRELEYIAPEQLDVMKLDSRVDDSEQELVNVFCIGLLIVCLITGRPCTSLYNVDNLDINLSIIGKLLNKAVNKYSYSEYFEQLVQLMIAKYPERRINYRSILDKLSKHDDIPQQLNPPGMQSQLYESTINISQYQSVSVAQQCDYSEIDRIIRNSRQKAQSTLDEVGLNLKLHDY